MTTKQLVQINAMARWITGLGLFEYPLNRPQLLLRIFYASCFISLYLYACVKHLQRFLMTGMANITLGHRIYVVISCIQMASFLFVLVNAWYRTKMCYFWYKQVDEIKMTMNSIGCRANDKSFMRFQFIFNIFIFVHVTLIIYNVYQKLYYLPLKLCAPIMYGLFYTVLVTLLVNAEFNYSVRYMTSLFGELNRKLSDMLPLRENQQVRVELDASTERHHLKVFKTIRRLHLELVRSSLYFNDLYALQNLVMTTTSVIMTAVFLYEIYSLEINKINEIHHINIFKLLLCLSNIVIVNLSCTRTTEEAHRTGSIINKLYLSISNEEFHSKLRDLLIVPFQCFLFIRQFTLQLIDNRLLFKVCGLFNLGRRLFSTFVNSIITYLVILIQATYLRSTDTVDAGSTMPPSDVPE